MNVVLFGAPGSGKGTASKILKERLGLLHLSTGDVLRENVQNGTSLGNEAKRYMDSGALVPDEVIIGMVKELLKKPEAGKGVIFDGFPRTLEQARALDNMLEELGSKVDVVLNIVVPFEEIKKRMANRRTCSNCKEIYSLDFNPPKVEGVCDICGGELIQREDEKEEVVESRLKIYEEQSKPVIEYYEEKNKLRQYEAGDTAGKNTKQIIEEFIQELSK